MRTPVYLKKIGKRNFSVPSRKTVIQFAVPCGLGFLEGSLSSQHRIDKLCCYTLGCFEAKNAFENEMNHLP